jgi:hypothetical protein
MGRDCGVPRPPLLPLHGIAEKTLTSAINQLAALANEPRGW